MSAWLGAPRFRDEEMAARIRRPGVALGLAATGEGGDVLLVEAAWLPGRGTLRVTGTVGPMTRESANVAMTWVRSHAERLAGAARFDDTYGRALGRGRPVEGRPVGGGDAGRRPARSRYPDAHDRRRTADRHQGEARGLARRRADADAARARPGTQPADLLVRGRARPGRQPGVVPDHFGGGPPDAGGRRRGPEVNRFQVLVSDDGDTRLERYGGDLKRGRGRSPPAGSV